MIPLVEQLGQAGMDTFPLWWALALGACLGGNLTIVGASANVVVANLGARKPVTHRLRRVHALWRGRDHRVPVDCHGLRLDQVSAVKGTPLRDPETRKDLLIVIGLFALGLIVVAILGAIAIWILQLLGWWDLTPLTVNIGLGGN